MKEALLKLVSASGLVAWERWRSREALRVVTYHGVDERDDPALNFDRLQVHPKLFERQIASLARQYRVVELSGAVRHWLEYGRWPARSLAITFDDGYLNNLTVAAPILNRLGVPATFFVTSSFIEGRSRPWWYAVRAAVAKRAGVGRSVRMEAARVEAELRPLAEAERAVRLATLIGSDAGGEAAYPFMNRANINELVGMGFDVQPHGEAHLSFRGETVDVLKGEVVKSVAFVRELTGRAPWGFAYPYGHLPTERDAIERVMRECGLQVALSTVEGNNGAEADRWALRRWDLHGGYSVAAAGVRVSGLHVLLRRGVAA